MLSSYNRFVVNFNVHSKQYVIWCKIYKEITFILASAFSGMHVHMFAESLRMSIIRSVKHCKILQEISRTLTSLTVRKLGNAYIKRYHLWKNTLFSWRRSIDRFQDCNGSTSGSEVDCSWCKILIGVKWQMQWYFNRVSLRTVFSDQRCQTVTYSFKPMCIHGWHDDAIKWKHFSRCWPFVREFTGLRWIPRAKASDAELWCFLWSAPG